MRGSRRYPTPRGKGSGRGPDKLETLIGECGSIGAPPTIVHAVLDALARFDIDNLDVPMMPLKVWTAICGAARQACKRRTAQGPAPRHGPHRNFQPRKERGGAGGPHTRRRGCDPGSRTRPAAARVAQGNATPALHYSTDERTNR